MFSKIRNVSSVQRLYKKGHAERCKDDPTGLVCWQVNLFHDKFYINLQLIFSASQGVFVYLHWTGSYHLPAKQKTLLVVVSIVCMSLLIKSLVSPSFQLNMVVPSCRLWAADAGEIKTDRNKLLYLILLIFLSQKNPSHHQPQHSNRRRGKKWEISN